MTCRSFARFSALALLALFAAVPARAELTICNKTATPISLAVAFETTQDLVSQGWWTLDPDQCQTTITVPLDRQYYYHYAVSPTMKVEWAGNFNFCTSDNPQFRISGAQSCEQRNYHTTGFRQIDVGDGKVFTLNIRGGPAPAAETAPQAPAAEPVPEAVPPAAAVPESPAAVPAPAQ
jgi:uncharacterized membrane protein